MRPIVRCNAARRVLRGRRQIRAPRQRGFTLIELMIAIAILAVVAVLSWRGLDQIIRGRDIIMRQMADERVVALMFGQIATDLSQCATDDEVGQPVVTIGDGLLRVVRRLRVPGAAPRLQVVRYQLDAGRIVRQASPGLATVAQLRAALGGNTDGWSALPLMTGVTSFISNAYVPDKGFTNRMSDVTDAMNNATNALRNPIAGSVPIARSVTGVEIRLTATGVTHPMTRVLMVGE